MAFKQSHKTTVNLESPESLLHDLRQKKIKGPFSHQADMWRDYVNSSMKEKDVAFQLPTGSGKTLVGLIIGEWRRRKYGERILYICPTNQLVNQVSNQANTLYGLNVIPFTGKVQNYNNKDKSDYQTAEKIAISSYSALFNTNPYFTDSQIIILDDAHSSENSISKFWSLSIRKNDYKVLFQIILSVLRSYISESDYLKISEEGDSLWDYSWVEKLAIPNLFMLIPDLTSIMDEHCSDNELYHSWKVIRGHLDACNLFYSMSEILIRPIIPPTDTHAPFANATQRIYMSATLGEGGDLERLTGRKKIKRLEIPKGWDKQGIGRRLFIFPTRSLDNDSTQELTVQLFKLSKRSLVLVPDEKSATAIKNIVKGALNYNTYSAKEIEDSKESFLNEEGAVAILANRYDGIDFPEDECRMLVVQGLPRATNLQEKFFIHRMGASILLNDRILTRIVQAFGRCTRSSTDYSIVEVLGDDIIKFLLNKERRKFLHPELQGELQFGLDESNGISKEVFLENASIFLQQSTEWTNADSSIMSIRDNSIQEKLPCVEELKNSVNSEVEYLYNLWKGDYISAYENCREVLGILQNDALRGYRALWNYLAGSSAWLATKSQQIDLMSQSKVHFEAALKSITEIKWLSNLIRLIDKDEKEFKGIEANGILIENIEMSFEKLGLVHNRKYDKEEKYILENIINNKNSESFENAQVHLGQFLGYEAGNKETNGAPDPWWKVSDKICFVFEDHSEAKDDSILSITKARQVATHPNWIKDNIKLAGDALIIPVLITPVKKVNGDAFPHLSNVFVWNINDYREWVITSLSLIRNLKKDYPESGDLFWHKIALEVLITNNITPYELIEYLKNIDYKSKFIVI
jgi:hypothetical protein